QVCSAAACQAGCFIAGAFAAAGALNPANACQRCQPATSTTAWTGVGDGTTCGSGRVCANVSCQGGCFIGGTLVAHGAANPAQRCESCQPAIATAAFTPLPDGATCGGGKVCDNDACLAGCFVGGAFAAPNAPNPANACQSCQPATST